MADMELVVDNYEAWQTGFEVVSRGVEVATPKAIALRTEDGELVWLPKSQICAAVMDTKLFVYVPAWLYRKNRKALTNLI